MNLWTIQEASFYDKLEAEGYIQSIDFNLSKDSFGADFLPQYKWLGRQMVLRGISRKPICPIWAWYKYDGAHKKPDLRRSVHMPRGTKSVSIEFEAENKMVVLSQFEMWVWILHGGYLPCNDQENTAIEKLKDAGKLSVSRIRRSWSRMFDLTFGYEDFWGSLDERWIQACVPEIHIDQVRKVQKFAAK
ncbi:MAG TPA: DUF3841 domain-containing protein [Phycisphaerales bacterium]|nr:DUF3841 domain-containing protein [Phycisphaerales bacterium]